MQMLVLIDVMDWQRADMKIPSTFKLGKGTYTVGVKNPLPKRVNGRVKPAMRLIELAPHKAEDMETFWHEVTHAILHDINGPVSWRNEAFAMCFARRLTQVIKTAKFKEHNG